MATALLLLWLKLSRSWNVICIFDDIFYPRPVLAFGYYHRLRLCVCPCVCVSLCVNHLLVRAITQDLFINFIFVFEWIIFTSFMLICRLSYGLNFNNRKRSKIVMEIYYSDITSTTRCLNSLAIQLFVKKLVQVNNKHHDSTLLDPLCGKCNCDLPDGTTHGPVKGPTWALSAPDGPHVGLVNLAIRVLSFLHRCQYVISYSVKMSWVNQNTNFIQFFINDTWWLLGKKCLGKQMDSFCVCALMWYSYSWDRFTNDFAIQHNWNLTENVLCCNYFTCAKFCSDHCIEILMWAKWLFHQICIVMEKSPVKWTWGFHQIGV